MKINKVAKIYLIIIFSFLFLNISAHAQSDVISNVKTAMKSGSSKELSKYFNDMVELNINGTKTSYSKTQAEFVMKDFFKNHPASDFQYVHQGASKEGIKYAIGKYTYNDGSFRVLVLIKQIKGNYLVDLIDFSKE
ncbi:MAG: DUF4783 domain-containing protein [Bacteroidota bacterium]|nr:DUF4783 domain-containing protein [Bacteroidota bacterium]